MSQILIDGISRVSFTNGLLRVDCVKAGADSKYEPSGTLLIPGSQAGPVLKALVNATNELERKQQELNAAKAAESTQQ